MSENLEDNEPRIIPPAVGNTQNEHVEPLIGTEHAPRVARSVSSDPEESRVAFFRCRHSRASGTSP